MLKLMKPNCLIFLFLPLDHVLLIMIFFKEAKDKKASEQRIEVFKARSPLEEEAEIQGG